MSNPTPSTAVLASEDALIGKVIHNYVVHRKLGEGGLGAVFEARHPDIGTRVAIKVLRGEMLRRADTSQLTGRFHKEAMTAARIDHDHVVRVTNAGKLDDGTSYLVMEYLEGMDLEDLVTKEGPLPESTALTITFQICSALHAAHRLNIIHRDIKPSNVFIKISEDGTRSVKLLDFGIAKWSTIQVPGVETQANAGFGTPHYMAPEQATAARDVDATADIYSVGVLLYRILTGVLPFDGPNHVALHEAKLRPPAFVITSYRPELSPKWNEIVLRCLQPETFLRYPDVVTLVADLRTVSPEAVELQRIAWPSYSPPSSVAKLVRLPGGPQTATAPSNVGPTSTPAGMMVPRTTATRRRRWPLVLLGSTGFAVLGGVLALGQGTTRSKSSSPASVQPDEPAAAVALPPDAALPPPTVDEVRKPVPLEPAPASAESTTSATRAATTAEDRTSGAATDGNRTPAHRSSRSRDRHRKDGSAEPRTTESAPKPTAESSVKDTAAPPSPTNPAPKPKRRPIDPNGVM